MRTLGSANVYVRETPDIETSSEGYASRFVGAVGHYLLLVQEQGILSLLKDDRALSGRTVLDVGGGHAQLAGSFAASGCIVSVVGSDEQCGTRLRSFHGTAIPFYAGDLLALPFADRTFDTVTSVRLISHMENRRGLVAELCRVANRTIIIDYPTYASLNLLSLLTFPLKKFIEKNTRTYYTFSDSEIRDMFAQYGFLVTASYRQFVLPMALHRLFANSGILRGVEETLRKVGLTNLIGNPVLLRLDRES